MQNFIVEITDTFGGEANYSWVRRYLVKSTSFRGAMSKVAKRYGAGWRNKYSSGDSAEYRMPGACIVAFVNWVEADYALEYPKLYNVEAI